MSNNLPDQLVVSISDIEMGTGGLFDDFPHTPWLARLIEAYAGPRFDGLEVHLVFNGDTFDFLKQPVAGIFPTMITEEVALTKLDAVIQTHPAFFEGIRRFLEKKDGHGAVHFVVGNHDPELFFEAVQRKIQQQIGHERVFFPGLRAVFGDLWVEHGSQDDTMFRFDPTDVFVDTKKGRALRLPWGSVSLLDVALPMHKYVYDLDRVKPRQRVFELLPTLRDLVVGAYWNYWRDTAQDWIGADPMKQVSWTMLKDVAHRFRTQNATLQQGHSYQELLKSDKGPKVITAGHIHQASWWTHTNHKLLYTGCFRDEFAMDHNGNITAFLPKVYAEIYLRDSKVVRSHLVEIDGPTPDSSRVLTSVFDVLPRLQPLLSPNAELTAMRNEEADQHKLEQEHAKNQKTRE